MFRSASANVPSNYTYVKQTVTGLAALIHSLSNMPYFKLLPWCIWGLYSSVALCSSSWTAQSTINTRCHFDLCLLHASAFTWPSSWRSQTKEYSNGRFGYRCANVESQIQCIQLKLHTIF